jgi:hypothetical protein
MGDGPSWKGDSCLVVTNPPPPHISYKTETSLLYPEIPLLEHNFSKINTLNIFIPYTSKFILILSYHLQLGLPYH